MTHAIDRLHEAVQAARGGNPAESRTSKLLNEGIAKMAKKVAEEAVEIGLDAVRGDTVQVVRESADLIYNLVVLWTEAGVSPDDVWREMERREQLYGIAEKLAKNRGLPSAAAS
jgi:phosphoribosyl-ATP pyrophosphohydrolase